jgi:hypothetical protein
MRSDLVTAVVRESFHKPTANRIVFKRLTKRRNPSRTPEWGQASTLHRGRSHWRGAPVNAILPP